jgi:hypothetical protein
MADLSLLPVEHPPFCDPRSCTTDVGGNSVAYVAHRAVLLDGARLADVVQVDEVTLDGRLLSSTGPDIAEGGTQFLTAAGAARLVWCSSLAVEERPWPARCGEKAARQPGFRSPRARPARAGRLQGC